MSTSVVTKVALVTGAARGLGFAVAGKMYSQGFATAMVDVSQDVFDAREYLLGEPSEKQGGSLSAFCGDVTVKTFMDSVYDKIESEGGLVQVCVPAAGITLDGFCLKKDKDTGELGRYPVENFRKVLEVNLIAPWMWAQRMCLGIRKAGLCWEPGQDMNGTVVLLGSVMEDGNAGQAAYSASKAGLNGLCGSMNAEFLRKFGIRFCVLKLGFADTPMVRTIKEEVIREVILPRIPNGRFLEDKEVANVISFAIENEAFVGTLPFTAGYRPSL